MKRFISILLVLMVFTGAVLPAYAADMSQSRAVIGADLSEDQINQVYQSFGLFRGQVPELFVTNAEERYYLQGLVDESIIGTRSISCVFVQLLPANTGMDVTTRNITWCTPQMYINALNTAGITDAKVIVSAPVPVSGTAGLTGIYKAYESMTGQGLDAQAKQAGTQELTITGELAQQIGQASSLSIVQELKQILDQTRNMTDEQIYAQIQAIASRYNVSLTDTQYRQLISLCRSLEGLDSGSIQDRVEGVQSTIGKVAQAKDSVVSFIDNLRELVATLQNILSRLESLFGSSEG